MEFESLLGSSNKRLQGYPMAQLPANVPITLHRYFAIRKAVEAARAWAHLLYGVILNIGAAIGALIILYWVSMFIGYLFGWVR